MTPQGLVAGLLALAVVTAWVRLLLAHRRDVRQPRAWRLALLLLLQPLLAIALYGMLFPPRHSLAPGAMTLLTEGATPADVPEAARESVLLALPEAQVADGVPRVPDLGTALRRYPGTTEVHVVGAGLVARDRDAAYGTRIVFWPGAPPRGLVRVDAPNGVAQGSDFHIAGRVEGIDGAKVELLDPAGRRIDLAKGDASGAFALDAIAFAAGPVEYRLRVRDGNDAVVDESRVALWIEPAVAPRVVLLAGAPNAETRALRRWFEGKGAPLQSRIALGAGVQLGGAATSPQALAQTDLLLVDARAWSALGESGRADVMQAVRAGMGLLLRADAPLPASALVTLRTPGFSLQGGEGTQPWSLPAARLADAVALRARMGAGSRDAPFDLVQAEDAIPPLARRAWRIEGADAAALSGDPLVGAWRAEGRGRIGVWTLLDSYQWPLHGRNDLYSDLWSDAVATLSRARAIAQPVFAGMPRIDERLSICGVREDASVEAPDGTRVPLFIDISHGDGDCAGFWPASAGWHRLHIGDAEHPFLVPDGGQPVALRLSELRDASLRIAATPTIVQASAGAAPSRTAPGTPWPWFVAWLLLAAATWSLERSRMGLRVAAGT